MKKPTWEDLKRLSIKDEPEEIHPDEAMRRLGPAFAKLRECRDGRSFLEEVERVFEGMKDGRIDRRNVNVHTIIGICQLAHYIRDGVSPSRKKSFNREAIYWLLELREKTLKKAPEDVVEFVLQKFEERNRPAPSSIRSEFLTEGMRDWVELDCR